MSYGEVTRARVELGEALRQARHAKGYSQAMLGRLAWLDQSVISRLENGRMVGVRFSTLIRLLDALEITHIRIAVW